MQVAARTGSDVRNFTLEVVRADGRRLIEYGHAVPLLDAAGKVTGSIGVFVDLTDLKKAEERLERTNEELRRVNEEVNQFAFAATHDLQEPVRMIALYSGLLVRSWASHDYAEAERALRCTWESANRMQELLRDLLLYIQVVTRGEPFLEVVDLNVIAESVRNRLTATIAETEAVLTVDPLPKVEGLSFQFLQLFQNLIENAIKYRRAEPPQIRVSVTRSGRFWQFAVADNGMGIEPEYRVSVFGMFKRLHGREIPGTGIGLAICRRVVERLGGRIWVESEMGSGCTFYFTIPGGDL